MRRGGSHVRSRARSWALQLLYGWEMGGEDDLRSYAQRAIGRRRVSSRYRPYLESLLDWLGSDRRRIDSTLERHIPNWRLERLAAIDRNILRIGTAELLFADDVPGKVAIHEAVLLAEKYGSEESPRFVNGVLDAIYRDVAVRG